MRRAWPLAALCCAGFACVVASAASSRDEIAAGAKVLEQLRHADGDNALQLLDQVKFKARMKELEGTRTLAEKRIGLSGPLAECRKAATWAPTIFSLRNMMARSSKAPSSNDVADLANQSRLYGESLAWCEQALEQKG